MRIGLIGIGRMGKAVKQAVTESKHKIVAEFDIDNPISSATISECEILIDFSVAQALDQNLRICLAAGIPLVSGTTGWYARKAEFKKLVLDAKGTFLYASNFSIGVLLFHKLLAQAAELYSSFNNYDFSIHEVHHKQKSDSPSGTALTLAGEILKKIPQKKTLQIGNPPAKIEDNMLQISSSRVGNVAGMHTLFIESPEDSIEITHRARGQMGFAAGALIAAEWLIGRKGFYTIDDMFRALNIKKEKE